MRLLSEVFETSASASSANPPINLLEHTRCLGLKEFAHFAAFCPVEGGVDGSAHGAGVEGCDADAVFAADVFGGADELLCQALAAHCGGDVEVEQVAALRFEVQIVWRPLHLPDAGSANDCAGLVLEKQADVFAALQFFRQPELAEAFEFVPCADAGELVVLKHLYALAGDEGRVGDGCLADCDHDDFHGNGRTAARGLLVRECSESDTRMRKRTVGRVWVWAVVAEALCFQWRGFGTSGTSIA